MAYLAVGTSMHVFVAAQVAVLHHHHQWEHVLVSLNELAQRHRRQRELYVVPPRHGSWDDVTDEFFWY